MKKIGGFFELEIAQGHTLYHDEAIMLSTGRACLNLVLQLKLYKKVYVPYYCCDALYEPLLLNDIPFEFYKINSELEIAETICLEKNEAIVYCDFFGIKSLYVDRIIRKYGVNLIIDNSHSFFNKGYANNISFTTSRKYFGVPDGAFLYMPQEININEFERKTNISIDHNYHRFLGQQEKAFKEFGDYEKSLDSTINRISMLSEKILKTVDYDEVQALRNRNFKLYEQEFNDVNQLKISDQAVDCFCYPLLLEKPIDKKRLHGKHIYIPTYWNDVTKRENIENYVVEIKYSEEILPLPIDHRYEREDVIRVINTIKEIMNG
jgi:hypothetical protein